MSLQFRGVPLKPLDKLDQTRPTVLGRDAKARLLRVTDALQKESVSHDIVSELAAVCCDLLYHVQTLEDRLDTHAGVGE